MSGGRFLRVLKGCMGITSIHGRPPTSMLMMGYSEQRIEEWGEHKSGVKTGLKRGEGRQKNEGNWGECRSADFSGEGRKWQEKKKKTGSEGEQRNSRKNGGGRELKWGCWGSECRLIFLEEETEQREKKNWFLKGFKNEKKTERRREGAGWRRMREKGAAGGSEFGCLIFAGDEPLPYLQECEALSG
ncbi:hypothetical protein CK203_067939 [Vitis vinifera]|uniref:Uncharacterized protein n=1 Tax=Vitis vinifera TaxID=29760 RepID=A0A438EWA9_VITVI|nr:hypothetical protein CK203_067939 [Vitis vinifera]